MKKEKQVRENGKAVSPKPQPKTPAQPLKLAGSQTAEGSQNPHSPLAVSIPLTREVVELINRVAQGAGKNPEEFMEEAILWRVQGQARLHANRGKQSKRELKRDEAALRRLIKTGTLDVLTKPRAAFGAHAGSGIHGLMDLEQGINEVSGLVEFLSRGLAEYQSQEGSDNIQAAACGTLQITERVMTRLHAVFNMAWEYYKGLPGQPGAGAGAASSEAGKGGAQ